jgi:hypothetical protein
MFAIVAGLALSACYSTGVRVTEKQVRGFTPGVTTYADVVKALGQPSTVTASSDGSRRAAYIFASASTKPASFIPYVGLFAGGTDTKSATTTFTFGPDQKLINYTTTDMALAGGMGTGSHATPREEEKPAAAPPPAPSVTCDEPHAMRCNGAAVETCGKGGKWERSEDCAGEGMQCSASELYCSASGVACCH